MSPENVKPCMQALLKDMEKLLHEHLKDTGIANVRAQPKSHNALDVACRIYNFRRLRERLFQDKVPVDLFGEPAWDMLLDLYIAKHTGKRISVSSLCAAASVPATTAIRWINIMVDKGLVSRDDDRTDGRRVFIELTDQANCILRDLLSY